jgi:Lanthionine-containing peptide SapB precursor RamS
VSVLDLQGMENQAPATGGDSGGGHHSASSASCAPSNLSVTLCHESVLSLLLC